MLGNGETHGGTSPCIRLRTSGAFFYGDAHKENLFTNFLILFLSNCHSVNPCVRTKMVRPITKLMVRPVQRPMVRPMVRLKVRLTTSQYTKDEKCATLRTPGADFFTGFVSYLGMSTLKFCLE